MTQDTNDQQSSSQNTASKETFRELIAKATSSPSQQVMPPMTLDDENVREMVLSQIMMSNFSSGGMFMPIMCPPVKHPDFPKLKEIMDTEFDAMGEDRTITPYQYYTEHKTRLMQAVPKDFSEELRVIDAVKQANGNMQNQQMMNRVYKTQDDLRNLLR